jgi:hypothetical protein
MSCLSNVKTCTAVWAFDIDSFFFVVFVNTVKSQHPYDLGRLSLAFVYASTKPNPNAETRHDESDGHLSVCISIGSTSFSHFSASVSEHRVERERR